MTWTHRRRARPCREAEFRASLDDGEFWNYVLLGIDPDAPRDDGWYDEDQAPADDYIQFERPCGECGELGPCGYDAEGRPMIHLQPEDEEA